MPGAHIQPCSDNVWLTKLPTCMQPSSNGGISMAGTYLKHKGIIQSILLQLDKRLSHGCTEQERLPLIARREGLHSTCNRCQSKRDGVLTEVSTAHVCAKAAGGQKAPVCAFAVSTATNNNIKRHMHNRADPGRVSGQVPTTPLAALTGSRALKSSSKVASSTRSASSMTRKAVRLKTAAKLLSVSRSPCTQVARDKKKMPWTWSGVLACRTGRPMFILSIKMSSHTQTVAQDDTYPQSAGCCNDYMWPPGQLPCLGLHVYTTYDYTLT
jgi:hypothetical protein